MKISDFSIRRRVATTTGLALAGVLGAVALFKLPIEFMPAMDAPFIEIHAPYEGASPVEICERIAEPIEEAVATLPNIKKMRTRCRSGYAYIGVELNPGSNMDYMVLDVQERIDLIKKDLPSDLRNLMILKYDTEQFPVLMGALTFPEENPVNHELVDRFLVRPLKTVEGVADIQMEGLEEKRVLVEVDETKLQQFGVNILQVFDALVSANLTVSAGSVDFAGLKHDVRITGEFKNLQEIKDLPVSGNLRIRDVAEVRIDYQEPFFVGRLNKKRAYIMMALKEAGANTVDTCQAVKAKLDELLNNPRLKGVGVKIWFDQSEEILTSIDILTESGIAGAVFAFIVLWIFLKDLKTTLIVSLAIPMSILATIAAMYFSGLTFNVITLSALILAVGMLVDNSIVVIEAIDLRRRQGMSPRAAASRGAQEVGLAIIVATSTTIIVFLPLIFTEETPAAVLMKQMGIVLVFAIAASLLISLTLIPMLSSRILSEGAGDLPRWFQALSRGFLRLLEIGLERRMPALVAVFFAFLLCVQIFAWPFPWNKRIKSLPPTPLIEKEGVPSALRRLVPIRVGFERKPPLEEIEKTMRKLEDLFMEKKEEWDLDTVAAIVSERFSRIMLVLPRDRTPRFSAEEIEDKAMKLLQEKAKFPGVTFRILHEQMQGPGGAGRATRIKVRGPDPEQVYQFAEQIRQRLIGLPGLKEIQPIERENEEELHVIVDRALALKYGFELNQVALAVSYAIRGVPVGQFMTGDAPIDIYIQVREADRKSMAQLESMRIQNMRGQFIPLKNIARVRLEPIPEVVRRDNRLVTVYIPVVPKGRDLKAVAASVARRLQNFRLPMGYSWVMGEELQEMMEDLKILAYAILIAIALVFLVMTAQFESFLLPFVIMFTIPFAMIGVVLALLVSRATFNVISGGGCLLLVGIVVNNAIVLVDHIHNLRKQGVPERESLVQAAADRFRPILMTALTTIVGLFPMALGLSDTGRMMYSPLAIAVLGGLAVSTFLTPFLIPIIYSLSDDLMHSLRRAWKLLREV